MEQTGQWIQLAVVAGFLAAVSAVLVVLLPRRRLVFGMVLLMFTPAMLMALVLGLGTLVAPGQGTSLSNLIFAVMLIGTIVVIPWMIVCAVGFAIGFAIRRRSPPRETASIDAEPKGQHRPIPQEAVRPPPQRQPPVNGPFAAWRAALVILIGAVVAIAGLTYMSMKTGIEPPHLPMATPHIPRIPH